jgi:Protein of unknown function (DUF3309)
MTKSFSLASNCSGAEPRITASLQTGPGRGFRQSLQPERIEAPSQEEKESAMIGTVLIVILVLALVGALPAWPYSRSWGYYPTGGLGLILMILIILMLLGQI